MGMSTGPSQHRSDQTYGSILAAAVCAVIGPLLSLAALNVLKLTTDDTLIIIQTTNKMQPSIWKRRIDSSVASTG